MVTPNDPPRVEAGSAPMARFDEVISFKLRIIIGFPCLPPLLGSNRHDDVSDTSNAVTMTHAPKLHLNQGANLHVGVCACVWVGGWVYVWVQRWVVFVCACVCARMGVGADLDHGRGGGEAWDS